MPRRKIILANNEIYHVYNRGIDNRVTFNNKREYERALLTISLYQYSNLPLRLSKILQIQKPEREEVLKEIKREMKKRVDILAYCLMPNHFHILLRQNEDKGTSKFVADFQNSFTRFSNLRYGRAGPLFLTQFEGARIENENQLVHVSRYIHLNPHTSFLVSNFEELERYNWCSFKEYLEPNNPNNICEVDLILSLFGKKRVSNYKKFVFNQKDYQRRLAEIKSLTLES